MGEMGQKWPLNSFLEIFEKSNHYCFLKLIYNESSYYLPCVNSNPISGKMLVLELLAEMFSANQIVASQIGYIVRIN